MLHCKKGTLIKKTNKLLKFIVQIHWSQTFCTVDHILCYTS